MMELKIKRIDDGINLSLSISFIKVRKKYQGIILRAIQELDSVKQYLCFKARIVRLLLKVLFVSPQKASFRKTDEENKLFLYWNTNEPKNVSLTKRMETAFAQAKTKILKDKKEKLMKAISTINILAIILQVSMFGVLLIPGAAMANDNMCEVDADVALVMDTSGSMADGENPSHCQWQELEWVGPSQQCVSHSQTGLTEQQCLAKPDPVQCPSPVFTAATPSKLDSAKNAAKSFIDNLQAKDQSAMIFFNDGATLAKALSNDHLATKATIDGLIANGSTNIGDAIAEGTAELSSGRANTQANKVMILLTDGKANRPNGPGYGEWDADKLYAEQKAQEAKDMGFKIFTVGLGSDSEINETMLQNIASVKSDGQKGYYHSPDGNGLSAIYQEIAWEMCQYGSISGCKYQDSDNDADITGENTLSGWEIVLTGNVNDSQLTDENGCYTFAGLLAGNYTVSEGQNLNKQPFLQNYPQGNSYNITLAKAKGENITNKDFGNYLPICGNSILDTDFGEVCEIGNTQAYVTGEGYNGIQSCNQTCSAWGSCVTQESCGDAIKNGNEECDGFDGVPEHYICTQTCTLEYVPYCGDQQINQITEQCDGEPNKQCSTLDGYNGWQGCTGCLWSECQTQEFCGDSIVNGLELCDGNVQACSIAGYNGSQTCNAGCDSWNPCEINEYCGDSITNGAEQCDDGENNGVYGYCNNDCTSQTQAICGNNILEGDEQCDDGNANNGDGCSAICEIEQILPGDIDNEQECLDAGYYWYGESCHAEPEEQLPINPGDIVINEIMRKPSSPYAYLKKWFELFNKTDREINLEGCIISDTETNWHIINAPLIISMGDYVVLGSTADPTKNGGAGIDYVYSNFLLEDESDEIIIECNSQEIDRVVYDDGLTFPDPDGASMILANPALDNNVGSNWCESTSVFGAGDRGTPGTLNDLCGGVPICGNQILESGEQCDGNAPQSCTTNEGYGGVSLCTNCNWAVCTSQEYCGDAIVNGPEQCDDGNTNNGDGCSSTCTTEQIPPTPPEINPGDIVINEIMRKPSSPQTYLKRWFEFYNNTNHEINLENCIISDSDTNLHTIGLPLLIPAHGYVVLAGNGNPAQNGGVNVDYVYSNFLLEDIADEIILNCKQAEIDRVEYDDTWLNQNGASMVLANPLLDNNTGSNWCESTSAFGAGDRGTPGTQNDSCGGIQCQASEISRECISDGQAQVNYSWNDSSCGQNYTQQEQDTSCACQLTDTAGDCASDGFRQHNYTYNFSYCGQAYAQNITDQTCNCQSIEISRQCVSDDQAEINYTYNYSYCGQDYTQTQQDLSCSSEYQCGEWQDAECLNDGVRKQTKTCTDQYQNPSQEERQISDSDCACLASETARTCGSDGYANINYSFNYSYCGQNYTQQKQETNCNCQETEIPGECVNDTQRQYTFTYNFGYCVIRDPEIRTDDACQQPAPEPEDIDNEQDCLENSYYWYNGSCHSTAPGAGDINNQEDCLAANYYWYEQTCHTQAESPAPEEQGTGGGGGGGAIIPGIIDGSIIVTNITETSVTIEWLSNYFSTSRVIYSAEGESHIFDINDNFAQPPLYGYTNTTPEYDNNPMVTYHSVTLTGLEPATTYYFNCISHASPDIISSEHSFLTAGVAGAITTEEQTKIEKINEIRQEIERIRQEIEKLGQKAAEVAGEAISIPEVGLSAKTNLALSIVAKINLFFAAKASQAFALTLAIYPLFLSIGLRKKWRDVISQF